MWPFGPLVVPGRSTFELRTSLDNHILILLLTVIAPPGQIEKIICVLVYRTKKKFFVAKHNGENCFYFFFLFIFIYLESP